MNTQQESRQAFDILWITQHEQKVKFVTLFQRFPRDNQKAEEKSLTSTDQHSQPALYSNIQHTLYTHPHTHNTFLCNIVYDARCCLEKETVLPAGAGWNCCGYGPKHSHMLPLPLPLPQCCCFGQQKVFFILAFTSEGKFYLSFAVIAKPTTTTTT